MSANEWCAVAYTEDGTRLGFSTTIASLVQLSRKAERFIDRDQALRRIPALEHAWRGHQMLWVVERFIPDLDIRTENAATTLDSTVHMGLPSSSSQREPTMPTKPKQTKQQPKPQPAKPPKSPSARPTKLLPAKPVMRTTAARVVEATAGQMVRKGYAQPETFTINTGKPCLCGCGELVAGYLKRGHFLKRKQRLLEVRLGASPEKVFGRRLAKAMGPWNTSRAGVVTPTTIDYATIRANLK